MPRILVMFFIFAGYVFAGDTCNLSTVEFVEARVIVNPDLDTNLLPTKTAFGCVFPQKGNLIVIQAFVDDHPQSVLVIPLGAVLKITGLKDDVPNLPIPQTLPNASPESVNKGDRPNNRRLM